MLKEAKKLKIKKALNKQKDLKPFRSSKSDSESKSKSTETYEYLERKCSSTDET
jgi:hypothetical protein